MHCKLLLRCKFLSLILNNFYFLRSIAICLVYMNRLNRHITQLISPYLWHEETKRISDPDALDRYRNLKDSPSRRPIKSCVAKQISTTTRFLLDWHLEYRVSSHVVSKVESGIYNIHRWRRWWWRRSPTCSLHPLRSVFMMQPRIQNFIAHESFICLEKIQIGIAIFPFREVRKQRKREKRQKIDWICNFHGFWQVFTASIHRYVTR